MPRKRVKSKREGGINLKNLTDELYESICNEISFEEILDCSELEQEQRYFDGYNYLLFNKGDPELCRQIWNMHKVAVMEKWKQDKNNAGKRPFLWWIAEAPEFMSSKEINKIINDRNEREYLTKWGLLKEWEKK